MRHLRFVLGIIGIWVLMIGAVVAFVMIPDKWERAGWREAVLIKICPGRIPIVRLPNGEVWARMSWSLRYKIEDEAKICRTRT
jgi:hypothetical protein